MRFGCQFAPFGLLFLGLAECQNARQPSTYQTLTQSGFRNATAAHEANERGLKCVQEGQFDLAEEAFRQALEADLSYAPAHNNLGNVLQGKRRYYEAATEFAFAAKLASRATEPFVNLGRLYEELGWFDSAVAEYRKALQRDSRNLEALGRLADVYVRTHVHSAELDGLLRDLAEQEGGSLWSDWAKAQLAQQTIEKPQK